MATVLSMPKLSATTAEATVVRWYKAAGDRVLSGEVVLEIETDKATLTIEAPASGILGTPAVAAGEVAAVGAALVMILTENEQGEIDMIAAADAQPPETVGSAIDGRDQTSAVGASPTVPDAAPRRLLASPLARRIAREAGIHLDSVRGTGPGGRIVRADIDRTAEPSAQRITRGVAGGQGLLSGLERLTRSRRQTAMQVTASRREIPAFVLSRWIDMEAVLADLAQFERQRSETDYLLYAIARAVAQVTEFRCVWNPQRMLAEDLASTNIGLVVSTDHGLLIPVLKDVGGVDVEQLAARRRSALAAARAGRLDQSLTAPASISLSSLIRDEADEFEAIISPGQTAIVAVGRIAGRVMPHKGNVAIRRGCIIAVAADHRVIDGRTGARFIGAMARVLEEGAAHGSGAQVSRPHRPSDDAISG